MKENKPSPSTQRYRAHPVHVTISQWREKLRNERPGNFIELGQESKDAYVRLRWILRDIKARLDRMDPMLAQINILQNINNIISNLQNPWSQYYSNPNGNWQVLNNHTDAIVSQSQPLPQDSGVHASLESLDELRNDMETVIDNARKAVEELGKSAAGSDDKFNNANNKVDELVAEIATQKARLDQMLTQHNETFSKAQQERAILFTNTEQDRQTKYGESQEKRKQFFTEITDEFKETANNVIKEHQGQLKNIEIDGQSKSDEIIDSINSQLDKAVEIVGTIVKTTMSGNYLISANREYRNAWLMRGVAILAFLGMGGMVIWAVGSMNIGPTGIDWSTFAFRLSLGTAFLIPGFYCAKESSRHWIAERQNRRIALELAALDPFLVKLDEAKQKEIIEKKADEYFGHGSSHSVEDDFPTLKEVYLRGDQLFKIVERVAKIVHGGGR
ncbi:MAG: hypothetical protein OEV87_13470 [Phycisphaerae bacterium]|nr:hypothetical protein [Phycisphaerae bacterium]